MVIESASLPKKKRESENAKTQAKQEKKISRQNEQKVNITGFAETQKLAVSAKCVELVGNQALRCTTWIC